MGLSGGVLGRFFEAVLLGCIPVIISDNLVLPFESTLDYASFSVKVYRERPRSSQANTPQTIMHTHMLPACGLRSSHSVRLNHPEGYRWNYEFRIIFFGLYRERSLPHGFGGLRRFCSLQMWRVT